MSERRSLILMRWGWMSWMFLHLAASGARSLVSVHQPPVVSAALGHDVIMPCELQSSHHDKMANPPVLYWERSSPLDSPKLWPPSKDYQGRIYRLDNDSHSANKSILFKHVQWTDGGKYLCKLSITLDKTKSFRKKGNETLLMVFDNITFNLTSHNDSRLQCEVSVSRQPGCVLSILHDGSRLPTVAAARGDSISDSPHVTLSESVSLRGVGKYECQLHVNTELITQSVFHYHLPGEGWGNVTTTCPSMLSGLVLVLPEPWVLYIALLLVPIVFLLGILTARVLCKS